MLISLFIIGLLFIDHNDSKPSHNNETTTVLKPTNSSNMTRLNKGQLWLDYLFSLMDKAEFLIVVVRLMFYLYCDVTYLYSHK
ncbi:unnamed protein product [Schistosoma bovis]|nr:unnamed protein product [Schistosoma bovis]